MVEQHAITFQTKGKDHLVDITGMIKEILSRSAVSQGMVGLFVPGSTGALTTIEYEPGLLQDFPDLMEKLVPQNASYAHNETWQDGNGYAHLRATLIGPSLTIPLKNQEMTLGTWQQIVFLEFDNRPRNRQVLVTILGD